MTAEEILNLMEVGPDYAGSYYLNGGFERRVTVVSQQIRGISLISALLEKERISTHCGDRIAIIGAGAAGITAAIRAAYAGFSVVIFERCEIPLTRFQGSNRLLHPRLYEWPRKGFDDDDARLPLLSWKAGSGGEVTDELRNQWDFFLHLFGKRTEKRELQKAGMKGKLDYRPECTPAPVHDSGKPTLSIRNQDGTWSQESFQAVIYAMGFGEDIAYSWAAPDGFRKDAYWNTDIQRIRNMISSVEDRPVKILLSGVGDSGLTDLFSCIDPDFHQETIIERFIEPLTRPEFAVNYREISDLFSRETSSWILQKEIVGILRNIQKCGFSNPFQKVKPLRLLFNCHPSRLFDSTTFPLNRLILGFLLSLDHVEAAFTQKPEVVPEKAKTRPSFPDPPETAVETTLDGQRFIPRWIHHKEELDLILVRHGADRSFRAHFPEVFSSTEQYREKILADKKETGEHLYRRSYDKSDSIPIRRFYSDFYDSIIQRQLSFALEERRLESYLVPLYKGRLVRDLLVFDQVILTDSQFLDGRFFRDWSAAQDSQGLTLSDLAELTRSGEIELCFRDKWKAPNWQDTMWRTLGEIAFGTDKSRFFDKKFVFSSLGSTRNGKSVPAPMLEDWEPCRIEDFLAGANPGLSEKIRQLFENKFLKTEKLWIRIRGEEVLRFWETLAKERFQWHPWRGSFCLESSFEDPWQIYHGLTNPEGSRYMLSEAFSSLIRSKLQSDLEEIMLDQERDIRERNDASALYEYYNRAYHRAIGRQHEATVIETTYVKRWKIPSPENSEENDAPPSWKIQLALSGLHKEQILELREELKPMTVLERLAAVSQKVLSGEIPLRRSSSEMERYLNQVAPEDILSWEPELASLLIQDCFKGEAMAEYRIYDDISPAARVQMMANPKWKLSSCCSILEFVSPLEIAEDFSGK